MLIVLPVLLCIMFYAVEFWGISTIYGHAQSLKYNSLSKMEVHGGLENNDLETLKEKLKEIGAKPETIKITGDILKGDKKPVTRPGEVKLRIEFKPEFFDNFMARTLIGGSPGKPIKIGVEGSVVSEYVKKNKDNK